MIELSDYATQESGFPLLTSSRQGLFVQEDYFTDKQASAETTVFSVLPYGCITYRHMSDDNIFHFNINRLVANGLVSKEYPVFTVRKEVLDTDFLVDTLNSSPLFSVFCIQQKKGGTRTRLYFKTLCSYQMFLPVLHEQQVIASFIRLLDKRIERQMELVETLKKYKRGLLSREFGQQENGDLNNRYVGKLKDYFHLSSGSTPSSTNRAFYSGNIRWVSSGELKPKYLCETSQHISSEAVSSCNLREYPANTLLIAMYGLEAAGVRGTASILSVPATISQACMAIQQTGEIDIEYLYYWYIYNGQWIGIRIAQGTKQQNLSTDTLGNLRIYAPSCSKQKKVCKLLSQIDYLIEKEGQKIDLLSSAKRGLLQQLFI